MRCMHVRRRYLLMGRRNMVVQKTPDPSRCSVIRATNRDRMFHAHEHMRVQCGYAARCCSCTFTHIPVCFTTVQEVALLK